MTWHKVTTMGNVEELKPTRSDYILIYFEVLEVCFHKED